jgi:beta-glucosidase
MSSTAVGQDYPFHNTSLPFDQRVQDLVGRLTLQEVVSQMSHGGAENNGPAPAIPRLGINPYQWGTECLSGDVRAGPATSFPQSIGLAATFDYSLLYRFARAVSDEVRAKNNNYTSHGSYGFHTGLSCWSPVINILRDPRWGRNQETYGEDPWLSGYLGRAFVTGLQGNNSRYVEANAGLKHFDVYGGPENIPTSRLSFNAKLTTRDWRMTFLPQFRECVEAGAWSLMCSFNSINGIPACANKELLTDILRNEWGFKGYVVSDQGAIEFIQDSHHYTDSVVKTAAVAVNAGTCLEDANTADNVFSHIGDAISQGLITNDTVIDAVSRLFLVRMRLGEFDPPEMNPYTKLKVEDYIQSEAHRQLSLEAAMATVVLMKNTETMGMTLPITSPVKRACVVGPFIYDTSLYFGDYAPNKMPEFIVSVMDGLQKAKIANTINFAQGCKDQTKCKSYDPSSVATACDGADLAIVTLGTGNVLESEGNDRADINLPGHQLELLQDAANSALGPVVLVLYNAGPLDISWAKNSSRVMAILEHFFPAQTAGTALANVLMGRYNPAGRLPNTWPASLDQVPPISNYTMVNRTYRYFEGIPLYPFGYGLSYTTFSYSDLVVSPSLVKAGDNVTVKVTVQNTGPLDGDEVTQVYLSWASPIYAGVAPIRQLVGAQRNFVKTQQLIALQFTVTGREMQLWTTKWEVLSGTMEVSVGGQQPNQVTMVPSNILTSAFLVTL